MTRPLSRSTSLFLLSLIKLLEGFSYWGFSTAIVVHLLDHTVYGITLAEANDYRSHFLIILFVIYILTGLISDFILKQKNAIITGLCLLIFGFGLLFIDQFFALFIAYLLIRIGDVFFHMNLAVLLGRFYTKWDIKKNIGFAYVYISANVGSFLGAFLIGYWADFYGLPFHTCLILFISCTVLALIIFMLTKNRLNLVEEEDGAIATQVIERTDVLDDFPRAVEPIYEARRFSEKDRLLSIFTVIISSIFFLELSGIADLAFYEKIKELETIEWIGYLHLIEMGSILLGLILLMLLWHFGKARDNLKVMGICFLILTLNILIFYGLEMPEDMGSLSFAILFFATSAFDDLFFFVIGLSTLTNLSKYKYASTTLGIAYASLCVIPLIVKYTDFEIADHQGLHLALISFIVAIVLLIFRKSMSNQTS